MKEMTVSFEGSTLVDWTAYQRSRSELGAGFVRILGYFREDVVQLSPLFQQTLALLEREANPLVARRPNAGFGRRAI
jgi:hypothetical protein